VNYKRVKMDERVFALHCTTALDGTRGRVPCEDAVVCSIPWNVHFFVLFFFEFGSYFGIEVHRKHTNGAALR
jgi:hypothetical protein